MIPYEKIVHKLSKMSEEIITLSDLKWLIDPSDSDSIPQKVYTLAVRLRDENILHPLTQSRYVVGPIHNFHAATWVSENYWRILSSALRSRCGRDGGVLLGIKPLEILIKNTLPPTRAICAVLSGRGSERLSKEYSVVYTEVTSGKRTGQESLWWTLLKYSSFREIDGISLRLPNTELALLEALTRRDRREMIDQRLLRSFLSRFHDTLDENVLSDLLKKKYILPLNRLRVLSRNMGYPDVYDMTVRLIRKAWAGCYVAQEKLGI